MQRRAVGATYTPTDFDEQNLEFGLNGHMAIIENKQECKYFAKAFVSEPRSD